MHRHAQARRHDVRNDFMTQVKDTQQIAAPKAAAPALADLRAHLLDPLDRLDQLHLTQPDPTITARVATVSRA
jgi:hypothetical protein